MNEIQDNATTLYQRYGEPFAYTLDFQRGFYHVEDWMIDAVSRASDGASNATDDGMFALIWALSEEGTKEALVTRAWLAGKLKKSSLKTITAHLHRLRDWGLIELSTSYEVHTHRGRDGRITECRLIKGLRTRANAASADIQVSLALRDGREGERVNVEAMGLIAEQHEAIGSMIGLCPPDLLPQLHGLYSQIEALILGQGGGAPEEADKATDKGGDMGTIAPEISEAAARMLARANGNRVSDAPQLLAALVGEGHSVEAIERAWVRATQGWEDREKKYRIGLAKWLEGSARTELESPAARKQEPRQYPEQVECPTCHGSAKHNAGWTYYCPSCDRCFGHHPV